MVATAKLAFSASPTQPRHPNSLADPETLRVSPAFSDEAHNFMSRDERQFRIWQFAVQDVQVRPADTAGRDTNQDLIGRRFWQRHFYRAKRPPGFLKNHRSHLLSEAGFVDASNELFHQHRSREPASTADVPKARFMRHGRR